MASFPRRATVIAALFVLILAGYFVRLGQSSDVVPPAFLESRQQGSVISQDIVNLSNEFSRTLEQINELDKEKRYAEALDLTTGMIQRIPELRAKALDLSKELEKMTNSLGTVRSTEARQAAVEYVTNRMALISRLLSYSEYLTQLSGVLADHFQEIPNNQSVPQIVAQVNAEISAINNFNRAASEAMERFDRSMGNAK